MSDEGDKASRPEPSGSAEGSVPTVAEGKPRPSLAEAESHSANTAEVAVPDKPPDEAPDREALGDRERDIAGPGPSAGAVAVALADLDDEAPPSIPSAAIITSDSLSRAAPAKLDIKPGELIGQRYEVLSVLGEGGMGIVYRCRDGGTQDEIAIKRVTPPEGKMAGEYIAWFYKEARALAALNHPTIVRARDFGQLPDGSPYLAMDLVGGHSLHDLAQAKLSYPLIWSIVDQVLSGLAHAHAREVVHGDLKPSNVLVEETEGGPPIVHLLDFGLAWLRRDPHDERLDGEKAVEWSTHAGAGTPGYMAPEQIQHEQHHVCGPTDLYSVGCILYKLLSGRSPFRGDSKQLLKSHAFEQPARPKLAVDAPVGAIEFVMRLLAKRPWDRFEFAAEARVAWSAWRPPEEQPKSVWTFPPLRNVTGHVPLTTRRSKPRSGTDHPAPSPERAPGLLSIRPSPLVGREDVRKLLRETCQEVVDNTGSPHRLVVLVGPAGVGKSRIAEWLCQVVHEEGTMVPLRARYRAMRGPLDGMLGAVTEHYTFEQVERDTVERSLLARWKVPRDDKHGRAWVAGATEWLKPGPQGQETPIGPSGVRFTLDTLDVRRLVIRYTLRRIARKRPLLFWLDDLHHASEATFDGLLRIHSDEPDQRIVMVATVRSEDVQIGTPQAERIRQLRERMGGAVVEVNPMSAALTRQLLEASLPLDESAVTEAARRSRGNPLFALQQLHAWAHGGHMELMGGVYRVPDKVLAVRPKTTAELWDSRLRDMPEEQRVGALATATLGADLRRGVMTSLIESLGLSARATFVSLQKAEVILPRGPGRYSWPHALLQEHLLHVLGQREDAPRVYEASAQALANHPLANTRRIVRLRVVNLLKAGKSDSGANLLFDFVGNAWSGAREPRATLADLDLLKNVSGRSLALKHRWRAEALRHVGKAEEAKIHAEIARNHFEEFHDDHSLAQCLRLLGHISSETGKSGEGLLLARLGHELFERRRDVLGMAQCEAVIGEIEYLLGNYDRAREAVSAGEAHFAEVEQPLGRGQSLLLSSWIDHSEGATERSRRRAREARVEFERAGYRLGLAQTDASLAHLEHRLMNFHSAEAGANDALSAFEALGNVRGQAACERLLAMVGIDSDDLDQAEIHAEQAAKLFERLVDPWGHVESRMLLAQVALARRDLGRARTLLEEGLAIEVEEAEPRQHILLTRAWLEIEAGDVEAAEAAIEAASDVFGDRGRGGDHTPHLLGRLSRLDWPAHVQNRIDAWRTLLLDRDRRQRE